MAGVQIDGVNNKIDFDDDLDTSISANTDDTLVIEAGGNTMATITATTFTINDGTTITTADNTDTLTLVSTDTDANIAPVLNLSRNNNSAAANDFVGKVMFTAEDAANNQTSYADIQGVVLDATDGSEDGRLRITTVIAGGNRNRLDFIAGEAVFNEDSQDIDFRVESNGTANMLFVNGGTNKVGIGTDAPAELLEVEGTGAAIQIDSNGDSALRFATSGTVKHSIFSSSGALNFFDNTNSANRWQIDATGNLVPGATSLGIYLGVSSATAANLLDDYEEGVTGNITINSNSGSVSLAGGFKQLAYTKVGRVVHMTGLLKPTTSDASGGINFALPFALADTSDRAEICRGFGYVVNAANANSAGGGLVLEVQTGGSTTCAIIKTTNSANGLTDMNTTYIAAGGTEISVDFSYIAA